MRIHKEFTAMSGEHTGGSCVLSKQMPTHTQTELYAALRMPTLPRTIRQQSCRHRPREPSSRCPGSYRAGCALISDQFPVSSTTASCPK
jgi:hypothetical protein